MRKVENSESQVARVEPIKWSLGSSGYAKNRNAGIKRLNRFHSFFVKTLLSGLLGKTDTAHINSTQLIVLHFEKHSQVP